MGKKQLIINLIANIISFSSSLLIAFFLTPFLISTIGKEAYGFYPMANNFVGYLMIITLALNSMASRFITIEIAKRNYKRAKEYFSSVFFSNVLLAFILSAPMIVIVYKIDTFLNVPSGLTNQVKLLFALVFIAMIISIFTSVFGVATFAKNRLDLKSYAEIVQGIMKIGLYIALFTIFQPSLIFIGIVAVLQSLTNLFIQVFFTKKLLPDFKLRCSYFDYGTVKELLSSGVWNSVNSLGSQLLLGVTLLLTNIYVGASSAGELAIVQTMPHFISSIISMLFSVFMPRITLVYAENSPDRLVDEVIFSQKVVGIMATIPILLVIIFGDDFFSLWLPDQNTLKLQNLSILTLIPLVIHANMWTIYGLNIVLNKVKIPSLMLIVVGIMSIFVSIVVLIVYSKSAYVVLIISGLFNIMYYMFFIPMYTSNQLGIKHGVLYNHLIKSLVFSMLFVLISIIIKQNIVISCWLEFFFWGGLFGVIGLLINTAIILKRVEFNKLVTIMKQQLFKKNVKTSEKEGD